MHSSTAVTASVLNVDDGHRMPPVEVTITLTLTLTLALVLNLALTFVPKAKK